jgi:four helix bundle protein
MTEKIRDFTDLMIWRKAVAVGKEVYRLTSRFPPEEKYGLTAQIRRAAVSVSSCIAEGHARRGRNYANMIDIARGSLAEVESQLLFAVELGYLRVDDVAGCRTSADEIHRMGVSLMKKLQKD